MSLYYYRAINFVKDYTCKYLGYVFLANSKNQLPFFDGTRTIEFSDRPHVVKADSWETRRLPAVLVGAARGKFKFMSISKDLVDSPNEGSSTGLTRLIGGDIDLSLGLSVMAKSIPERDNLVDIVCIYLSHPDAKDYFMRHNIIINSGPSISGEGRENIPALDFPVYKTTVDIDMTGSWQHRESPGQSLIDIITNIEVHVTL